MVTLKIEGLVQVSVKENNLIKIYGQIDRIGGKSITVSVEAESSTCTAMKKWWLQHASSLCASTTTGRASQSPTTFGKSTPTVRLTAHRFRQP